jgi:maltose alpha-D-glucosyltransferase/alpha-amylase
MRLNLGIRRRLAPLLDNNRQKIEMANSLLFTLPGSPTIYYGDEIGMGDNIWLHDRNGVRTPMQWENGRNAGFSTASNQAIYISIIENGEYGPVQVNVADQRAESHSLFNAIRHMIAIRKQHKAFGWGDFNWEDVGTKSVAAYTRGHNSEHLLILNNLSNSAHTITLPKSPQGYVNLLSGKDISSSAIDLQPYQFLWLSRKA